MSVEGHCSTTTRGECVLRGSVYPSPHPPALPHPSSRPLRSANAHHSRALRGRGTNGATTTTTTNSMKEEVMNESSATLTSSNLGEDASHTVNHQISGHGASGSQQVVHNVARSTASNVNLISTPARHNKSAQDDTAPLLPPISPHPRMSLREERGNNNNNASGASSSVNHGRGHKGRVNVTTSSTTTSTSTTTTTTNSSTNSSTSNDAAHSTPYLRSHGIPVMLNRLYRSVIQTRPEDKLQFIIDELQRQTQQEAEGGEKETTTTLQTRPRLEPPTTTTNAASTTLLARMPTSWPDGQQQHLRSASPVTLTPFTPPSPVPPLRPTSARNNILLLATATTNTTQPTVLVESAGNAPAPRPVVLSSSSSSSPATTSTVRTTNINTTNVTPAVRTRAHPPAPRETTSSSTAQRQSTAHTITESTTTIGGATSPEPAPGVTSAALTTPARRATPPTSLMATNVSQFTSSTRSTIVVSRNGLLNNTTTTTSVTQPTPLATQVRLSTTSPNMTQFGNTQYSVASNSTNGGNGTLTGNALLERDENGSRGELSSTFSIASVDVTELLQEFRARKNVCVGAAQREVSLQELAQILHTGGCFDFLDIGLVQDLFDELSAPCATSATTAAIANNGTTTNNNNTMNSSCRASLNSHFSPNMTPTMSSLHSAATLPWRGLNNNNSPNNNNNNSLTRSPPPVNNVNPSNNNNNSSAAAAAANTVSAAAAMTASSLPIKADSRCSLHDAIYEAAEHPTRVIAAAAELTQHSLILPANCALEEEVNELLRCSEQGGRVSDVIGTRVVDFEALLARMAYKIQGHYPEEVIRRAFLDLVADTASAAQHEAAAEEREREGGNVEATSASPSRSPAPVTIIANTANASTAEGNTTNVEGGTLLISEPSNASTTSGHPLRSLSHTRPLTNGLLDHLSPVTSSPLYGSQRLNGPLHEEESYSNAVGLEQRSSTTLSRSSPRLGETRTAATAPSPHPNTAAYYSSTNNNNNNVMLLFAEEEEEMDGSNGDGVEGAGMNDMQRDALRGVALEQLARTVPLSRCLHDGLERRLGLRHLSPAEMHAGLRVLGATDSTSNSDASQLQQEWGCHVNDFIKLVHTVVAVRQNSVATANTTGNTGLVASALSRLASPATNAVAVTSLAPSPTTAALPMKRNELYAARHAAPLKVETTQAHLYIGSCTGVRQ